MQVLANGLLQGILIGTTGMAFALVYRTAKVFHMALGGIIALAPYLILVGIKSGTPWWITVTLAGLVATGLGAFLEDTIHWPLERKRASGEIQLIASLGAYLIIIQIIALIWGNETQVLRSGIDGTWVIGGVTLAQAQLLGPLIVMILALVLVIWLNAANRGLELRALADNPILVAIMGIDVRRLRRRVFGISGALAAAVSVAMAWDVGFDPHIGLKAVLLGMVAMIIGGAGNFVAPLAGGVALGILRAEVVWFGSARWEDAVTFALLGLFLFFRPQGIFARKIRLEEEI